MTTVTPRDSDPDRTGPPKLLIADDDAIVASLLATQLRNAFDLVPRASDADEAIELARRHQPDVAIIDVQMPRGGGLRATQEIQLHSPATAIVAFSADESDSVVRQMIAAGAVTYVRKGLAGPDLVTKLRQSIEAYDRLRGAAVLSAQSNGAH